MFDPITPSLALGMIMAPVGVLVLVLAIGVAAFAYSRKRRRASLDAYRPPGALSDPEAAAAGLPDESRSHTIQVSSTHGSVSSASKSERKRLFMRLPGDGSGSLSSNGGVVASSNSSGSKEMSPVAADDEIGRPNWVASGIKTSNLPPTASPPESPSEAGLGALEFAVAFDSEKGMMVVTVLRATDLPARGGADGAADPYVKLQLLPDKKHRVKTRVLRHTNNPVYEETFTFYGISAAAVEQMSLHLVVLSFDRFSRDDIIGEVLCPLREFDVVDKEVALRMSILPRQLKVNGAERGDLLLSLAWQPAANRLTVVVLKARSLPQMDVTGLAGDPYVKIYLLVNGQRVAKKKTHVKKRTLNPVFNESFVFELPAASPTGSRSLSLEQVALEVQVLDWDRVTKSETIGRLLLGPLGCTLPGACPLKVEPSAAAHWTQLAAQPRKQIAEWHHLVE